jgi:hypothetical protein
MLNASCKEQSHWTNNGEFEAAPADQRWIPIKMSELFSSGVILLEAIGILHKYSLIYWNMDTGPSVSIP